MRKKSLHPWISRWRHRLNENDLFLTCAKISLFFLCFSSGPQRLVLTYAIYSIPQRSVVLFYFFWLVLDRKRSQRTARLVVACKASPIKSLCKIKSYALKKAIIFRSTRVATQSHNFCGSFEKQSANCRTERTPATPSYVNAKEEII